MSKRFMIILIFILSVVFYSGCNNDKEMLKKIDEGKPVKSIQIEEVQSPVTLRYIGTVTAGEIKKLSFKTSGYVDTIFIKKGQLVKKGDTLAKLDIKDLEFSLKASKAQMNIAKKQYEKSINGATQEDIKKAELSEKKAHDAYKFAADNYKKIKKLFAN
ncbi:MAG: biotin/lipoyl-binding protein, partial [Clostridia bacterium]|nr:biotin/lipoyl-binding protein [Clostridia bacterium]